MSMPIAFQGEVMLLGWKETHSGGAQVAFLLSDPDELEAFKRMTVTKGKVAGQRLACVLVEVDDENTTPASRTGHDGGRATTEAAGQGSAADSTGPAKLVPNELARRMHVDGYFRNPKLWAAMEAAGIYTQAMHKAWIEAQDCSFASERDVRHGPCQGDTVLHHVNSAAIPAAGHTTDNPRKPPHWYGLPLCAIGHHQNWAHASTGATRADKERMLVAAVNLTAERMKFHMKQCLKIDSLRELTQAMLTEFEERIGL